MVRRSSRIEQQKVKDVVPAQAIPTPTAKSDKTRVTNNTKKRANLGSAKKRDSSTNKPTKKKPKKTDLTEQAPSNPSQRGYLEHFAKQAPLDVLLEIFMHLWPREIIYLSRTSKALREVLMSRSSTSIWRAARINAGLPPLPPDLSEPQYASLAFDPYCQVCGRGPCENTMWTARMKCHKKCLSKLPRVRMGQQLSKEDECWSPDVAAIIELDQAGRDPFLPSYNEDWNGRRFSTSYNPSVLASFCREYQKVKDDLDALKEWCAIKRSQYQTILKESARCEQWHLKKVADRKAELDEIRWERANEILNRLAEDGWEEQDLSAFEDRRSHALYQLTVIDEDVWPSQKIEYTAELKRIKEERLVSERRAVMIDRHERAARAFKAYCREYSYMPDLLPMGDFVLASTQINDLLWGDDDSDDDGYLKVIKADFHRVEQEWTGRAERDFLSVMKKELPDATVENVRGGWREHYLTNQGNGFVDPTNWRKRFDPFRVMDSEWRRLWLLEANTVVYDPQVSNRMRNIIELCGYNPASVSPEELEKADPHLECLSCRQGDKRLVMRWTRAVSIQSSQSRPPPVGLMVDLFVRCPVNPRPRSGSSPTPARQL
ncbi:hypothetical protein V5O48_005974 [Marasmius crinis-equi]|uniref:F-box domain-containing protein n=1 Tax=Marasmius crinis-equi TaxID=585013 RepID=A0ABR3FKT5_9AGAR